MKKNSYPFFVSVVILVMLVSCSSERNTFTSKFYHNMTAYFNPYYIVKEDHKKINDFLWDEKNLDFTRVLPLYPNFDSTKIETERKMLENDIKLSSKTIDWHKNSKWVNPGYINLGKTFFYLRKFEKATSSFKIAYRKSDKKDVKDLALIESMHNYTDNLEFSKAYEVKELLEKRIKNTGTLSPSNNKLFLIKSAILFQREKKEKQMLSDLLKLSQLKKKRLKKKERRSYVYFTIAQLAEKEGNLVLATEYYQKTLKSNPSYLLDFHAKIRYYQVSNDVKNKRLERMRKYFKKLLRDEKNKEFKDNIYYEWGLFEYKYTSPQKAISLLKKAASYEPSSSPLQKGLIYLKIGKIYYKDIKNFTLASQYYDSTSSVIPHDYEDYQLIIKRKDILKEFAEKYNIINTQDSLLTLSMIPKDEIQSILSEQAKKNITNEKKRRKKERKKKKNSLKQGNYDKESDSFFSTSSSQNKNPQETQFYFYNAELSSLGTQEFIDKWGNRENRDNWRRANAQNNEINNATATPQEIKDTQESKTDITKKKKSKKEKKEKKGGKIENEESIIKGLYATIPFTDDQKASSKSQIDVAMLALAKIYHYKLNERQKAIETLREKIERFTLSATRAEALYLLYLIYKEKKEEEKKSETVKSILLKDHSGSLYAKLVINPAYREDNALMNEKAKNKYGEIYAAYSNHEFKLAQQYIEEARRVYFNSDYMDNYAIIEGLILAKLDKKEEFVTFIEQFPKQYPKSEMIEYVNRLKQHKASHEEEIKKILAGIYKKEFDTKHHFVITFPKIKYIKDSIIMHTNQFIRKSFPSDTLLVANASSIENYYLIHIKGFKDREKIKTFYKKIIADKKLFEKDTGGDYEEFDQFAITYENLNILRREKVLTDYLDFFEEYYPDFLE